MASADDLLYQADMVRDYGFNAGTLRSWRSMNQGPPSFRLGARGRVVYRRSEVEKWLSDVEQATRRGDVSVVT
jgi:hypothetical protein